MIGVTAFGLFLTPGCSAGGIVPPFVRALVNNLDTPGIEISLLFRKVRDEVMAATGRKQEPFTYGSLPSEELFFRRR